MNLAVRDKGYCSFLVSGWVRKRPGAHRCCRGTGTPAGPRARAPSRASGTSLGRGPERWGVPVPGDAPARPDASPHIPLRPAAAASGRSPAVGPTRAGVGWVASQRCPSLSTLQVPFQPGFSQGLQAGLSLEKPLGVSGARCCLPLSPRRLPVPGAVTGALSPCLILTPQGFQT